VRDRGLGLNEAIQFARQRFGGCHARRCR
jgi:hypothetical protein